MRQWGTFLAVVAFCCLIYPPFLGFCLGAAMVYTAAWVLFQAMGG
jgi:hypothetical protein